MLEPEHTGDTNTGITISQSRENIKQGVSAEVKDIQRNLHHPLIFLTTFSPAAPPPITLAHSQSSHSLTPPVFRSPWCVCMWHPGMLDHSSSPWCSWSRNRCRGKHYFWPLTWGELTLQQPCGATHPWPLRSASQSQPITIVFDSFSKEGKRLGLWARWRLIIKTRHPSAMEHMLQHLPVKASLGFLSKQSALASHILCVWIGITTYWALLADKCD